MANGQPSSTLGLSNIGLFADSALDETLNRGPLALLMRQQYEFPFGINIVQFSILSERPWLMRQQGEVLNYQYQMNCMCA